MRFGNVFCSYGFEGLCLEVTLTLGAPILSFGGSRVNNNFDFPTGRFFRLLCDPEMEIASSTQRLMRVQSQTRQKFRENFLDAFRRGLLVRSNGYFRILRRLIGCIDSGKAF
jgi:hypothetical protein